MAPIGHFGGPSIWRGVFSLPFSFTKLSNVTNASSPITAKLRLKSGRQFPFLARHPWVHAHALADSGENLTRGGYR